MQSESNNGSVANDFLLALVCTSQEPALLHHSDSLNGRFKNLTNKFLYRFSAMDRSLLVTNTVVKATRNRNTWDEFV